MYRSAGHLEEFHNRARAAALGVSSTYEVIYVNDGSPDNSLDLALKLQRSDPNIRVIDLASNHGHHRAIMIGLSHARGDLVFYIDCDLEEPPECLADLVAAMSHQAADVAYAVEGSRRGRVFRDRILGGAFFLALNAFSDVSFPNSVLSARLMTRRFLDQLLRFHEREIFITGLMRIAGFKQVEVAVSKTRRATTSYTFRARMSLARLGITGFSQRPLSAVFTVGVGVFLASLCMVAWTLYNKIAGSPVQGFSFLAISIWLLGGLLLLAVGIVALYLGTIFTEVKQRPYAIKRAVYEEATPD